jgi:hypothetical protein
MIDLTLLAALLLTLRLVSVGFLLRVLWWQWHFVRKNDSWLRDTRLTLFVMTIVLLVGNIVPIVIDTAALTGGYDRAQPPALGLLYAFSNAATSVAASAGLWFMYRQIDIERKRRHHKNKVQIDVRAE